MGRPDDGAGPLNGTAFAYHRGLAPTFWMFMAWTAEELKRREVLNLALLAWPNVMVEVDPPVRVRRRAIGAIAHKLDDPAAFAAAIRALERGDG